VTLRGLILTAFLPVTLFEIGNGAISPVLALTALHLGASPGRAAFTLSMLGVGQVVGDIPAAALAARLGERRAMILGAVVALCAQIACVFAGDVLVLDAAVLCIGMATAVFSLSRQAYVMESVPLGLRARAMSSLGGSHRIGLFAGPFLGALMITLIGIRGAFWVAVVASAATTAVLLAVPDVPANRTTARRDRDSVGVREVWREHWRLFVTLGNALILIGAIRAARQTVLPLWAAHIGLSAQHTSLIFGIASAVDISLFYPAGKWMDRAGRLAVSVPSMLILGGSMMALPLTRDVAWFVLVAVLMSAGNGLGSGLVLTLGADVAPYRGRLRFLSMWRVMGDSGNALGPIVVSAVAALYSLASGIIVVGVFGPLSALGLLVYSPRYSPYATYKGARLARGNAGEPPAAAEPNDGVAVIDERAGRRKP